MAEYFVFTFLLKYAFDISDSKEKSQDDSPAPVFHKNMIILNYL